MKKLFFFGKVYPQNTPIIEIKRDIEARLFDYTKVEVIVEMNELSKKELEIILHRGLKETMRSESILDQDTWLISGEGYNGFVPEYALPPRGHVIPNAIYSVDTDDFIDCFPSFATRSIIGHSPFFYTLNLLQITEIVASINLG